MSDNPKVVVITGAASGIGRSLAHSLISGKNKLVLTDVNEDNLKTLEIEFINSSDQCLFAVADVTHSDQLEKLKSQALEKFKRIDVWINNAGVMPTGHFVEMNAQIINHQIGVNLKGVINGMQCILPYFEKVKRGQIINISSVAAKVPLPYASIYSATKSAIFQLTEGVRIEYSGKGLHLCCIFPGAVNTPLTVDMKKTTFPPVIEPEKVVRAITKCIKKPKRRVYVPWYLGPLSSLQVILPQYLLEFIGEILGITDSVRPSIPKKN